MVLVLLMLAQTATSAADDEPVSAPNLLNFVQGEDVWVPGWVFSNSDDWLALSCTEQACQLVEAALKVTPASWQGHHDEIATSGQRLAFRTSIDSPGKVVAWIRQDEELSWLRPGAIEFYYAYELSPIVQNEKDTYEIIITSADESPVTLAPVLRMEAGQERSYARPGDPIFLLLRAAGAQQLLSEQIAACSGELNLEYLLWSGDLDRDGRTDYLIDYTDSAMGTVRFYLSSYAKPGQLVGEAGIGVTQPLDGDCA